MDIDIQQEVRRIEELYDRIETVIEQWSEELPEPVPAISTWSPVQHIYHVSVASGMMFKGVRLHAEGRHPYAVTEGEPTPVGRYVLTRERMMRGKAQAPKATHPPSELSLEEVRESVARSRAQLEPLRPFLSRLATLSERSNHPFFGALTPAEWLRVARIHLEHHLSIIEDILRARTPQ